MKRAIQTAARLGADAVELDARGEFRPRDFSGTAIRQLRKTLDDLNLHVCAVSFRTRRGYNVMEDLQQRIDATENTGASLSAVNFAPTKPTGRSARSVVARKIYERRLARSHEKFVENHLLAEHDGEQFWRISVRASASPRLMMRPFRVGICRLDPMSLSC